MPRFPFLSRRLAALSTDPRWRRLGTGSTALVASRCVTAACGLIQVPVVAHALRVELFGAWLALSGLLWSLNVLDFGLGFAVQNEVSFLLARGESATASAIARKAFRRLLWISVVFSGLALAIIPLLPWSRLFGLNETISATALPGGMVVLIAGAGLCLPFSLGPRLANAHQELWIVGLWTSLGSALALMSTLVVHRYGGGLAGYVAASALFPATANCGTLWHLRRRIGPVEPAVLPIASDVTTQLWRDGFWFFIPQASAIFIGNLTPTLVAVTAGSAAVASFGSLQRILGFALQIQSLALSPTWPMYAQAKARNDLPFARKVYRGSWWMTAIVFVLPTLLLSPWIRHVVTLWLGAATPILPNRLIGAMVIWQCLQYLGIPIAMVLNGFNQQRQLAMCNLLYMISLLLGIAVFGPIWGAAGVVAGMALPYLLINLPYTGWKSSKVLRAS